MISAKKSTVFSPSKAVKQSFHNQIVTPYYVTFNSTQFPQLGSLSSILLKPQLKRLYDLIVQSINAHLYKDAIFFADKLMTLTGGHIAVVYLLGQAYFLNGDFKKVHSLFVKYKFISHNINFQVLAAKALHANKQYQLCLNVLDLQLQHPYLNKKLEAVRLCIKGKCSQATQNKANAINFYTESLKRDPTCVEAFNRLIDSCLLCNSQKEQLLSVVNFNQEDQWLRKYYTAKIRDDLKFQEEELKQQDLRPENLFQNLLLKDNIDLLSIRAKNAYMKYDIPKAYQLSLKAVKEDPLYIDIIPIYCASLLELNQLGELYYCAHNLVENYTSHPLAWFAVGCYYYLTKKYQVGRKYFQKAITLDRTFIYAWIGMAHSFAIQDQSDQAMSVYRTISRLFPGCSSAHLYTGMQYLRTNNLKTAFLSFGHAKQINSNDPLVYNQIGVINYRQKNFNEAKEAYLQALELSSNANSTIVETLLSNLGHCYRKMKDYKNAIKYFQKCVSLNPQSGQTFFVLGFTHHMNNQLNKAINYYHKALKWRADNQFVQDMLSRALTDAAEMPWQQVYNV